MAQIATALKNNEWSIVCFRAFLEQDVLMLNLISLSWACTEAKCIKVVTALVRAIVIVNRKKKRWINPLASWRTEILLFSSSFRIRHWQEVNIPSSSFYMSFKLDTYSLRDVIVIVCSRKFLLLFCSLSEQQQHGNKCSIIAKARQKERRRKTHALVLKQIRLSLISFWEKKGEKWRMWNESI